MRFNPETAAAVFGQVLTGSLLGKMQQQERQRQLDLEQQQRDQQQTLFKQAQEDRTRERVMAPYQVLAPHIGKMDPASQALFLQNYSQAAGGATTPTAPTAGSVPAMPPMDMSFLQRPVQMPVSMGGTPAAPAPEGLGATADQVRMNAAMQQADQVPATPDMGSIFGYQPSPFFQMPAPPMPQPFAAPPPGWQPTPTPAAGPTETVQATETAPEPAAPDLTINAAGGQYRLAGVDKDRAQAVGKRYDAIVKALRDLPAESPLRALIASRLPSIKARPSTLDELENAESNLAILEAQPGLMSLGAARNAAATDKDRRKEVDADIDAFRQADPGQALPLLLNLADRIDESEKGGGKRGVGFRLIGQKADIQHVRSLVQQAEETSDPERAGRLRQQAEREAKNIQGRVGRGFTTDQENQRLDKAFRAIRLMSSEELAAKGGAKAVFEEMGIGYLVDGIDSNFAGAKLEERWDKILRQVAGLAGKDEGTQKLVLGEAQRIARLLGKKVKLPAKVWKKLNELEKVRLERSRQLISIEGDKQERADAMLEMARARNRRAEERHAQAMKKLKQGGSDVKPAAEHFKNWRQQEKRLDDALSIYGVTEDETSWADAALDPEEETHLRTLIANRDEAASGYYNYLNSRGVKISDPFGGNQSAGAAPTGAPAHAGLEGAIPEENRGQRTNRAIARGTATTQAAPATTGKQKYPYSNYLEGFRYWRNKYPIQKYPQATDAYIQKFLAGQGFRKGR